MSESNWASPQIVMVPSLMIYLVERIARWLWPAVRCTELVDVELIPGKERVVCIRMAKPTSFYYRYLAYPMNSSPVTKIRNGADRA